MNLTIAHIMLLLMPSSVVMAQQRLVVVNVESKVPIRDVRVCTDNGQERRTSWDGSVAVPDSFLRIDFLHPDFERRYVLKSELHGDTIFLIPNTNALHEVVIYGERRFVSPLGLLALIYNLTLRKKVEDRARRKKALKEIRKKEEEFQHKWDSLRQGNHHKQNRTP